jgi:nicotinamide riboside kinase
MGHLNRILVRWITDWNPMGVRAKGRPQSRWRDEALDDLKKLKLRNWNQIVKGRKAWNDMAQKTKFQTPCRL